MTRQARRVVHLLGGSGAYSEIWLDAQIRGTDRYRSEAWRQFGEMEPYHWVSRPSHVKDVHPLAEITVKLWRTDRLGGVLGTLSRLPAAIAANSMRPEPTVFHAHFGTTAWSWLGLIQKFNAPLVVSFYGFDASESRFKNEPWRTRYGHLFERTSAVLVEGPAMAERITNLCFPRNDIHVVRLPFTNVELPEVERIEPVWDVIMAGRFVEKKGFDIGLEAFAKASPTEGRMLVVGSGPLEKSLRNQTHRLGIADRVTFKSPVPLQELARLIEAAKAMLFPSRTASNGDGEGGAPMTLTLAQSLGTPVIVTDHDDLAWASAPGTPVVREGDSECLADALSHILARQGKNGCMAQVRRAQSFVSREHESERLVNQREAVYDLVSEAKDGRH